MTAILQSLHKDAGYLSWPKCELFLSASFVSEARRPGFAHFVLKCASFGPAHPADKNNSEKGQNKDPSSKVGLCRIAVIANMWRP